MAQRIVEATHPWPAGTADAESSAQLRFERDTLRLAYVDMSGLSHEVEFRGVAGFRWTSDGAPIFAGLRDDLVYDVLESDWAGELRAANPHLEKRDLRHTIIGFNEESSWLEIVFESWNAACE